MGLSSTIPNETPGIREVLSFVGLSAEKSRAKLSGSVDSLVKSVTSILDEMLLGAIEKRTAAEFADTRRKTFPAYFRIARAMSELVSVIVPSQSIERLATDSLSSMEMDMRNEGLQRFGAEVRDQAIFTVWTQRKINALVTQLKLAKPLSEDLKDQEADYAWNFNVHVYRTQFHLDCLTAAIRFDRSIYPEVISELTDGLRSAVDAYGWIRQAINLRIPQEDPAIPAVEWDDEDQDLVREATLDEIGEPI